jgi:small subunit ribosomal protein S21
MKTLLFTAAWAKSKAALENSERGDLELVTVTVRDNNIDQALRVLKKKMQREGIFREMKLRRDFEKPCEKRKREKAENIRRSRKMDRKRRDRY